ncbi:MAG: hypothetical protein M1830_008372 [Pleopsidium flavum]|nr:MAG: hypothetical protein M1830_008372 [Pleopsidium flavum]
MAEGTLQPPQPSIGAKAAVETVVVNGKPSHETTTWTTKPIKQDVVYEDRAAVEKALAKLERLTPLVTPTEVST